MYWVMPKGFVELLTSRKAKFGSWVMMWFGARSLISSCGVFGERGAHDLKLLLKILLEWINALGFFFFHCFAWFALVDVILSFNFNVSIVHFQCTSVVPFSGLFFCEFYLYNIRFLKIIYLIMINKNVSRNNHNFYLGFPKEIPYICKVILVIS